MDPSDDQERNFNENDWVVYPEDMEVETAEDMEVEPAEDIEMTTAGEAELAAVEDRETHNTGEQINTHQDQADHLEKMPEDIMYLICIELDYRSLARLCQTNISWSRYAVPHSYRKNAAEGNSSAVIWAAGGTGEKDKMSDRSIDHEMNKEVLSRALRYGGNVNAVDTSTNGEFATALHLAASLGRSGTVQQLLEAGADAMAVASGYRAFKANFPKIAGLQGELYQYGPEVRFELMHTHWHPLLLPFLRGQCDIMEMLFQHGATSRLAAQDESSQRGLTAFHIFAAMSPEEFASGEAGVMHRRIWREFCGTEVNITTDRIGLSPLHLAADMPNLHVLGEFLERSPAFLETQSGLDRTPLSHAVNRCAEATNPQRRKKLFAAVKMLIAKGADVNAASDSISEESSLGDAIVGYGDEWSRSSKDLKKLLVLLIENGANVNGTAERPGIIPALCRRIVEKGGNQSFEDLLSFLMSRGGNINHPVPRSSSILLQLIECHNEVPTGFFHRVVVAYGAELQPREASDAMDHWMCSPKLRRELDKGYAFLTIHRENIDKYTFECAWKRAFENLDDDLLRRLQADAPPPLDPGELVAEAMTKPGRKPWRYIQSLQQFDVDHVSGCGGKGFLHMVVERLQSDISTERQAIQEAGFFIDRGTSVCAEDGDGYTAIQRLHRFGRQHDNLALFLYEARDRELGDF